MQPFSRSFKILPFPPIPPDSGASCEIRSRDVGVGRDEGEFYKVVELLACDTHLRIHAHLYSRRSDSWRDLGNLDLRQHFRVWCPVMLSCSDGHFAHWYTKDFKCVLKLLTFDMKNEVIRTTRISVSAGIPASSVREHTVAKDESSFILIVPPQERSDDKLVRVYESSIREENGIRMLSWNHVVDLDNPVEQTMATTPLPLWRRDCVIKGFVGKTRGLKALFYDHGARRFIGCFQQPPASRLYSYEGTFISP